MKITTKHTLCIGLVSTVLAVVLAIACSAPTKVGVKVDIVGVKMEVTVDSSGHPITSTSGSLPPGKCLKITYSGPDGEVTGTATISVPGSCPIPSGSVRQEFETIDCPQQSLQFITPAAPGSGSTPASIALKAPIESWRDVFGYPILPDTSTGGLYLNAAYHFRVRCAAAQDPLSFVTPILLAGPGAPVPENVDIVFFAQMIPENTGARFLAADTDPFTEFRLDWNGVPGYADLASRTNITQFAAPNHWTIVETFIPLLDFNGNIHDWNGGLVTSQTQLESHPSLCALEYQTLAF